MCVQVHWRQLYGAWELAGAAEDARCSSFAALVQQKMQELPAGNKAGGAAAFAGNGSSSAAALQQEMQQLKCVHMELFWKLAAVPNAREMQLGRFEAWRWQTASLEEQTCAWFEAVREMQQSYCRKHSRKLAGALGGFGLEELAAASLEQCTALEAAPATWNLNGKEAWQLRWNRNSLVEEHAWL